ncbi:MAG: branched-chain amino acid ABC transporter permease [Acidobacteria bacterium]|nr:branched-chain amino acid ABC transporter permease [Acidobacteriota bacterium]
MLQVVANGIAAGARVLIVAVGFYLILRVARFLHLAHAVFITAGAYSAYTLYTLGGIPFLPALCLAVIACGVLGGVVDATIYRSARRTASSLVLLLISLGLYIAGQNIISLVFGDAPIVIRKWAQPTTFTLGSVTVTLSQVSTVLVALTLVCVLAAFLQLSRTGRMLRAVGSNMSLARISGIRVDGLILHAFVIGSAFAAIAGILACLEVDATPSMGLGMLMLSLIAVIAGWSWGLMGISLISLILGVLQHLTAYFCGAQWQDVIAFAFLTVVFVLRGRRGIAALNGAAASG